MSKSVIVSTLALFACALMTEPARAQHEHSADDALGLGSVNFPTSCSPSVQPEFNRAVAMLHSFWYQKSAETFAAVAKQDTSCGMAEWGVAMTHYRQLWDPPTPADLQEAWEAIQKAKAAQVKTQRERDYIAAIEIFYKDSDKIDHHTRAMAYEEAMEQIHARYPQDNEATIFYALAVRADAPAGDRTFTHQRKASALLETILAVQPDHPGLAHYIIHCDDYPSLAEQGLAAARHYAQIAPDSPHALHMPSHIFTRLGLWQESIASNLRSAAVAHKNGLAGDELHALDYLVYAFLQTGQDGAARRTLDAMPKVQSGEAAYYAGLYATASIPARFSVERHQWAEAAALAFPQDTFPGGRYISTEADLDYARALGAARTGDVAGARSALARLSAILDQVLQGGDKDTATLVDIQREVVIAWISLAQGQRRNALHEMRAAADHEDSVDKPPVTPGAILPARELLGEMLLESKQPAPALVAFESALGTAPGRLNSIFGAAHAAQLSGDRQKAKSYYSQLLVNCPHADPDRSELRKARLFLAGN